MGIYQLYFLKMHSKLLFLSRNAGTKDPAFLSRVLADTLAAAKEAMRGRNFAHSPYRTKIINRKPQQEAARTPLRSACSRPIVRLPMAGLRGCAPSRVFSPLFRAKKRCRRRPMPSVLTAERQRPQGADQIESRAKHCRQYFAQRVQSQLRRKPAMAGQGRSPCVLLGFQRGHSLR